MSRTRTLLTGALFPLTIFSVNLLVSWRYFRAEYTDQLPSIEGAFLALEAYIRNHWPAYDWFPMWFGGMPFTRTYQPGLHYAVAFLSAASGLSIPSAYHALTAITYSLGGVAFYFLAQALSAQPVTSFCGAMLFSLFSPSTLLVSEIQHDVGGIFNPRRLQVLAVYGEGPNVTGLTLAMFALAAVHLALRRRNAVTTSLAGIAVALVPITNWPAAIALVMAMICYAAAVEWSDFRETFLRLAIIGLLAFGFASPFALPSTIFGTFARANAAGDGPTPGPGRWISFALLFIYLAFLRAALIKRKVPFALRFSLLWTIFSIWFVLAASAFGIRMIPQPMRFHIAMEIPIILTAAIWGGMLASRWPADGKVAVVAILIFCAFQVQSYRRFSTTAFHEIDVTKTPEYDLAKWADTNMHGQRIYTIGTFGFWLNVFTETPQAAGFFNQSVISFEDLVESYISQAGYSSDRESADYSLLWLKAWAADAIQLGGPNSADVYKAYRFPDRFRAVLPMVWSRGDDWVYRVPERTPGLARVVRIRDFVRHAPINGIDVEELRPFVRALDDTSLAQARFQWQGTNAALISGTLAPDEAVAVSINYDPGWTARSNGRPVPLHSDGLGLIAIEPSCSGACDIQMRWSAGWEPTFGIAMFLIALTASIVWCWRI
jgi:hypothetical protein